MSELISRNEIIDILAKMKFFQGQRAGRELWNNKSVELQDEDIKNFNRDIQTIRKYILHLEEKSKWIPVSERLPQPETEVFILAKRKGYKGNEHYIVTTAMYEDGTILENDSIWRWEELDGEWNEEEECYIIPEGWWEHRHYNIDGVYNNCVDDEVVAWMSLPESFIKKGESNDSN